MDHMFLKAAAFYNDEARCNPQPLKGSVPSVKDDFRFMTCPDYLRDAMMYRLDYCFSNPIKNPGYCTLFLMPGGDGKKHLKNRMGDALDAILTLYYHDKWMEKNAHTLTLRYKIKDWFLSKFRRLKSFFLEKFRKDNEEDEYYL